MLTLQDFKRLIRPITNRIYSLINWGILKTFSFDAEAKLLRTEAESIESFKLDTFLIQQYGLSIKPLDGAEGLLAVPNGIRQQALVMLAQDRQYTLEVNDGEVALYTYVNNSKPHKILLKNDGSIEIFADEIKVFGDSVKLGGNGLKKLMTDSIINKFNTHTHLSAEPGLPTTAPPDSTPSVTYSATDATTKTEAS